MGNANSDQFHQNKNQQPKITTNSVQCDTTNSDDFKDLKSIERQMYSITKNPIVQRRKLKQNKLKSNKLSLLTYEAFGAYY
ncbi:unnamed protein product [Paramecium primaurelia]|uniref:Uncharacterized protein n=1 Tax=Paramecium primaurelia TaxID=5886 RepID=A0A8S1JXP1_PARPR|nr:unnamed protein product [Paramecium primaurelia]